MKKHSAILALVTLGASVASISLAPALAFAETSSPQALSSPVSGSNYILVTRANLPGANQAVRPSKSRAGRADPSALFALNNSSTFFTLQQAFQSGKMIIMLGNGDGKLSQSLLRQAFNSPGPETVHNQKTITNLIKGKKTTTNLSTQGIAIVKFPGEAMSSVLTVRSNNPMQQSDIIKAFQQLYTQGLQATQTQNSYSTATSSSATSSVTNAAISPNSDPNGSANYYSWNAGDNFVYNGSEIAGVVDYSYVARRISTNNSNSSEWSIVSSYQITPGQNWTSGENPPWQNDAMYMALGFTKGYTIPEETLDSFAPNQPTGTHTTSFTYTFSDTPSVAYSDGSTVSDVTYENLSHAGMYGAWNYSWKAGSSDAHGSYDLQPGVTMHNSGGEFVFDENYKVDFSDEQAPSLYQTSGDIGDTAYIPDL